jgi:hypothetical protein
MGAAVEVFFGKGLHVELVFGIDRIISGLNLRMFTSNEMGFQKVWVGHVSNLLHSFLQCTQAHKLRQCSLQGRFGHRGVGGLKVA